MFRTFIVLVIVLAVSGCMTRSAKSSDDRLTVAAVQKEIKIGMSGADVIAALGSPNMVSTDSERREVWVYDKVATESMSASSDGWVFGLIVGGRSSTRESSTTQRTLTIVIKFDENKLVRDFSYHSSQF